MTSEEQASESHDDPPSVAALHLCAETLEREAAFYEEDAESNPERTEQFLLAAAQLTSGANILRLLIGTVESVD